MRRVPREKWSETHHRLIFSDAIIVEHRIRSVRNVRFLTCAVKDRNE
ncbi:endonuclease III [Sporolactobacillus inulinus]|uniref:Endonuclease III n=1 Tax=Sporolactobacillus inulinus TaxID=2078 RepID=A0A4Y1ZBC9_9BACL|nr:endonuclease III [Sporolactobacillus inulinus]